MSDWQVSRAEVDRYITRDDSDLIEDDAAREFEPEEAMCEGCGWYWPVHALTRDVDRDLCPGCYDRARGNL